MAQQVLQVIQGVSFTQPKLFDKLLAIFAQHFAGEQSLWEIVVRQQRPQIAQLYIFQHAYDANCISRVLVDEDY